jgi:hypothetical protein
VKELTAVGTLGITGLPDKSAYAPDVATVAKSAEFAFNANDASTVDLTAAASAVAFKFRRLLSISVKDRRPPFDALVIIVVDILAPKIEEGDYPKIVPRKY